MIDNITISLMKDIIITDQRKEGEAIIGKTIETDKTIEVMTLDRDMEIGVRVGIDPEIIATSRNRSRNRDGQVQNRSRTLSNYRGGSRSRSDSRISMNRDRLRCYR